MLKDDIVAEKKTQQKAGQRRANFWSQRRVHCQLSSEIIITEIWSEVKKKRYGSGNAFSEKR